MVRVSVGCVNGFERLLLRYESETTAERNSLTNLKLQHLFAARVVDNRQTNCE